MEGFQQHCLEAGMDAYISKPVRIDQLAATLQKVEIFGFDASACVSPDTELVILAPTMRSIVQTTSLLSVKFIGSPLANGPPCRQRTLLSPVGCCGAMLLPAVNLCLHDHRIRGKGSHILLHARVERAGRGATCGHSRQNRARPPPRPGDPWRRSAVAHAGGSDAPRPQHRTHHTATLRFRGRKL